MQGNPIRFNLNQRKLPNKIRCAGRVVLHGKNAYSHSMTFALTGAPPVMPEWKQSAIRASGAERGLDVGCASSLILRI